MLLPAHPCSSVQSVAQALRFQIPGNISRRDAGNAEESGGLAGKVSRNGAKPATQRTDFVGSRLGGCRAGTLRPLRRCVRKSGNGCFTVDGVGPHYWHERNSPGVLTPGFGAALCRFETPVRVIADDLLLPITADHHRVHHVLKPDPQTARHGFRLFETRVPCVNSED